MSTQLVLSGIRLQDAATFENFHPVQNEQLYFSLKNLFVQNEQYFYLWGKPGAGCSHLLQACCHAAHEQQRRVIYLPLKQFAKAGAAIFDNLETLDLVAIDDLEYLQTKELQIAFFHLFNRISSQRNYLLLAAHSQPNNLSLPLADLVSRLNAGMLYHVHPLDEAHIAKVLQIRAEKRGMRLSSSVVTFLINHLKRDSSVLFEALDKLDAASLIEKRALTIPFVKSILNL